jgi:hypothetical protein
MTSQSTLTYNAVAGKQAPEQFESGLKDTLTTTVIAGLDKTSEQSGLTTTATTTNEERLETKAKL